MGAIIKLGISNHTLAIEAGGWTNIERENPLCKQCTQHKISIPVYMHKAERPKI